MKYKVEIRPKKSSQKGALESYLNSMAKKNWQFVQMNELNAQDVQFIFVCKK
ncbi:hypothetical protein KORDIASMS9_02691 [Kordia sp. SMS9]|uniref:hypothetical protein n=1 Tax=Kordia sp. SMS9 TaxID=2282170 RepID=UPI000E10A0B2|nr:hypothetical protein [Kordia sp. SMS9]AXG70451.1 hypothetical protein KORDIASMS9_02691 [Kordia sp. SMS9]